MERECVHIYIYNMCIYIYIYIFAYVYMCRFATMREYVCYVGRLKGSMYLVNMRLVVNYAAKN